jgi:hypothetical protein
MSHFYGELKGGRGVATRTGHRTSGLSTNAASWAGCIRTDLYVDEQGRDCFRITQTPWQGAGIHETLIEGVLGVPSDCGVTS